jgi:hypothetical protein
VSLMSTTLTGPRHMPDQPRVVITWGGRSTRIQDDYTPAAYTFSASSVFHHLLPAYLLREVPHAQCQLRFHVDHLYLCTRALEDPV